MQSCARPLTFRRSLARPLQKIAMGQSDVTSIQNSEQILVAGKHLGKDCHAVLVRGRLHCGNREMEAWDCSMNEDTCTLPCSTADRLQCVWFVALGYLGTFLPPVSLFRCSIQYDLHLHEGKSTIPAGAGRKQKIVSFWRLVKETRHSCAHL